MKLLTPTINGIGGAAGLLGRGAFILGSTGADGTGGGASPAGARRLD
ncbi:MAG: hypothetical protein WKF84_17200 [Pyrinomonadaceae bacterium]